MNVLSLRSYNHCKERYKQRFNDDLSENDFEDIIKLVQKSQYFIRRDIHGNGLFLINFKNKWLKCPYNNKKKSITTIMGLNENDWRFLMDMCERNIKNKKHELMSDVYEQIKNQVHKKILNRVINDTQEEFFLIPASTTGMNHPKSDRGMYGNIIHILKCLKMSEEAARRYNMTPDETDLLKLAVAIHDMPHRLMWVDEDHNPSTKEKSPEGKWRTNPDHAYLNGSYLRNLLNEDVFSEIKSEDKMKLIAAVSYHMGIWQAYSPYQDLYGSLYMYRTDPIVLATQECDFYTTRKFVDIEVDLDYNE